MLSSDVSNAFPKVLTLSSNVSNAFAKVLKLSSEVSECEPLQDGGVRHPDDPALPQPAGDSAW